MPQKVQIKLFADNPEVTDPEALIPVFHRWIRDAVVKDELLIDVADYTHVHHGPGILLVGHQSDYYYDHGEGRWGVLYSRKRDFDGDFPARLRDALRRALEAARELAGDDALGGLRFGTSELLVRLPDRLAATNDDESFAALEPALRGVLEPLFEGATLTLSREGSAREPLTVRVRAEGAPDVETLLALTRAAAP